MESLRRAYTEVIQVASTKGTSLRISGQNTRAFLLSPSDSEIIDTQAYQGIITYEPDELFITARAGTPLRELEETLKGKGQHLCFEPPSWGSGGTVGGMVASGFAGPRRMRSGPLRDHLLGVRVLDGQGRDLHFGGTVIKNVAGYDVSRLFAGSWGQLGLLLDVTLKVLPKPTSRLTLAMDMEQSEALRWLGLARTRPWPLTASQFKGSQSGRLWVRLEGGPAAVHESALEIQKGIPMREVDPQQADALWKSLQALPPPEFSQADSSNSTLWRISLPPTTPPLPLEGDTVIEWEGGLRWWRSKDDDTTIFPLLGEFKGWATPFDSRYQTARLPMVTFPSEIVRARIQSGVQSVFDPAGIFRSP